MVTIRTFQKQLLLVLQRDVQVCGTGPFLPAFHTQQALPGPWNLGVQVRAFIYSRASFRGCVLEVVRRPRQVLS